MGQKVSEANDFSIGAALMQIESAVALIRDHANVWPLPASTAPAVPVDDVELARHAARAFKSRRLRESFIDASLLGEPAWDLLLDLFEKRVNNRPVSVTSACKAASVPDTTALRWLNVLLQRGLVERRNQESDRRSSLVHLSDRGVEAARQCLQKFV